MKQLFTRHCVRLLMLFVGLFALSPAANAYNLWALYGDKFGGWSINNTYQFTGTGYDKKYKTNSWPGGYFLISANNDTYRTPNINSNVPLGNGGTSNLTNSSTGSGSFTLNGADGKATILTLKTKNSTYDPSSIEVDWAFDHWDDQNYKPKVQIKGNITGASDGNDGWNTLVDMSKEIVNQKEDDNQWYIDFDGTGKECYFRVVMDGTEYGPNNISSDVKISEKTSDPIIAWILKGNTDKAFYFATEEGYTYRLKIWHHWGSGNDGSGNIRWDLTKTKKSSGSTSGEIGGGGSQLWIASDSFAEYRNQKVSLVNGEGYYVLSSKDNDIYFIFNKDDRDNPDWNGDNVMGDPYTDGVAVTHDGTIRYNTVKSKNKYKLPKGVYTVQIEYYDGSYVGFRVYDGVKLPKNEGRKNKVYLVGNIINNNTPSPAWEMTKNGSSWQLGNFAMRFNDNIGVIVYSDNGTPTYYDMTSRVTQPTKNVGGEQKDKIYSQAGWTYTATWNGSALTLNPGSFNVKTNILPYIGILGQNFVQSKVYNTPLEYGTAMGKTSYGWQEAYIEYGSNGAPLTYKNAADKELTYYNTVWPPRHNILMQAEIDGDKLNVTSSELSLKSVGTSKTGSQWEEELYGTPQNVKNEDYEGLDLEDGRTYVRYVVNNMWMQGPFKIWTGWGGKQVGSGGWGANWDSHIYWGPTKDALIKEHGSDKDGKPNNNNLSVGAGITYDGSNDGGSYNYKTSNRAFFQTMELFIPVNDTNGFDFNSAKVYMTEAPGGAQIDAVAKDSEVGYYPTITQWPVDYKISSYRITRYAYDANVSSENFATDLKACDRKRDEADYGTSAATVKTQTFTSESQYLDSDAWEELFTNLWNQGGNYISDNNYDPGRYIFRLEVTFKNGEKEKKADVWSPYVEIITSGYTTDLDTYQLIRMPNGTHSTYQYLTYDEGGNYRGVALDDDGETVKNMGSLNIAEERLIDIVENTGVWTNKVLFVSKVPNNFLLLTADKQEVTTFDVIDNATPANTVMSLNPLGTNGYYMGVTDLTTDLTKKYYKSYFKGYVELGGESGNSTSEPEGTMDQPVVYAPHFMLPSFGEASLSFDSESTKTVDTYTASHADLYFTGDDTHENQQSGVRTNRHMLQADIEILMPNVSSENGLKTAVFNALNMEITKDGKAYKLYGDGSKSVFGMHYKYQNPTDWLEPGKDESGEDSYVATPQTWTFNEKPYSGDIIGVNRTVQRNELTLKAAPKFTKPEVNVDFGNELEKAFRFTLNKKENDYYLSLYANRLEIDMKNETKDILAKDEEFKADDNTVFMVKVTDGTDDSIPTTTISKVMETVSAQDNNHPGVVRIKDPENPILTMKVKFNSDADSPQVAEVAKNLKVEIGYAYYFSAGGKAGSDSEDESQNAGMTSSGYEGFTSKSQFPTIRYDHPDDGVKANVKAKANGQTDDVYGSSDPSNTLASGDNAFLFVPKYTVLDIEPSNLSSLGMPTGVENIGIDAANITVGKGFIDLNGNAGVIYSADGRMVYNGANRAEVATGVYIVTLGNSTAKVFVK